MHKLNVDECHEVIEQNLRIRQVPIGFFARADQLVVARWPGERLAALRSFRPIFRHEFSV